MNFKEILNRYKFLISSPFFIIGFSILLHFVSNVPIYVSIIIILFGLFIPIILILYKQLTLRSNQIKNIRGIEREMTVVSRILNENGDTTFNSRIKIINRDKNQVEFLYKDFYSTPGDDIELSEPKLVNSSIKNIKIHERVKLKYDKLIRIADSDKEYKYIECDYRINPPLKEVNDFIEYDLDINAKGHAKSGFNDEGEVEGFIVKNIARKIKMILISPDKYKIKLEDYWVEDHQANRINYLKSIITRPQVIYNDSQIQWKIDYPRMNYLYLFRYRIKKR